MENAIREYIQLQEIKFDRIYTDYIDCNSLTESLLNTRSLKRHVIDISRAKKLVENETLCLKESQITNDTDFSEVFKRTINYF